MKRAFLVMVVSALLVTLGFGQTPDAGSNTSEANVKGCLGGSEGSYTVAEDGTRQIFKISTSTVDLKAHLGHDVNLTGHKASAPVSPGTADNTFAVTGLDMISEHCAVAAAAPAATVSTPAADATPPATTVSPSAATVIAPAAVAAVPAMTVSPSAETASTPAVEAAPPTVTISPSPATASTPAVEVAPPAAVVSPSAETASTPAADAPHPARQSAHPRRRSAKQAAAETEPAATVSPSSDTVIPTAADTAIPAATANPPSATASTPTPAATTKPVAHKGGSLWLLISFVVLVIALGVLAPVIGRWRKRKMLERTSAENLSFSNETSPEGEKPEPRKAA